MKAGISTDESATNTKFCMTNTNTLSERTDVQLVFDSRVLADALLGRGPHAASTATLLDRVEQNEVEGWCASASFTTVFRLIRETLEGEGSASATACAQAKDLVRKVTGIVKPLPQAGDEIGRINDDSYENVEAALLVHLAENYLPNPLIVTNDDTLLGGSRLPAARPNDISKSGLDKFRAKADSIDFIDLKTQQRAVRLDLDKRIQAVLRHGQYILGPEVKELEERLAAFAGVEHCISVSSGTDSLLIALMALGIGPGDEVITVPYTWISSAEVIGLIGAKPVFVDIDPETWNMDPAKLEAAITPRTKAIMPVGIYGQPADMTAINAIAEARGDIPVLEDAAQCFGATHHGRQSSGMSTIGSTSFFPSKPLGGYGDGGALFTNDEHLAGLMRQIRVHGQARKHHHPVLGLNGRLDTLQAAVVLVKLDRFEAEIQTRQAIADAYISTLTGADSSLRVQQVADGNTSVWAQFTLLSSERETLAARLKEAGIPSVSYYAVPLHLQPVFADLGYKAGDFPVTEEVSEKCLSLPMGPDMDARSVRWISEILISEQG